MPDTILFKEIRSAAEAFRPISASAALDLLHLQAGDLPQVFACAAAMRSAAFNNRVSLCAIVNAKSGACSEDCAYCAQSRHASIKAQVYPFMPSEKLQESHKMAADNQARYFGVVTSGRALNKEDVDKACETVRTATDNAGGPYWCASMGCLNLDALKKLRQAGFKRYHHNLEAAPSFFPTICSSHTMEDRLRTLRNARTAGLELCSGGIFGLGESKEQRVELAQVLAAEKVDSIPINFIQPIEGTRLQNQQVLSPTDILLSIAMLRMTNPKVELRIAAGRKSLGRLQSFLFMAGCSGMMIGDMLTTSGEDVVADHAMLRDLEMEVEKTST